jgi:hypothetical protein
VTTAAVLRSAMLAGGLAIAGHAALAEEPLSALLDKLAPAKAPQGSVEVLGWVERAHGGPELVVTLTPKGAVKLVADPGVTVTPVPRAGLAWSTATPVTESDPDLDYFAAPLILRVPFGAEDGQPVEADVEYAYCVVDYQCLFGAAKVAASTRAPQG